jgi:pyrroline-5-carboxylate reductase
MSKIAFLGAGNMAGALVNGLLARAPAQRAELSCLGGSGPTAAALAARTGITLAAGLPELIGPADVVVVAFKPQHLAGADPRLAELTRGKLVLSVLAGKTLATLAQVFPHTRNLVRTMPNTPAAIGAGITPYYPLRPLTTADRGTVESLLGACGQYVEVGEEQMNAVTAVSGSGPAFVFEFVAALRDGGVAAGLSRELAGRLAVETALGAAKLLAHRQADPEVLRNEVTSPNGTTMAGLKQLEAADFRGLIRATVLAAQTRAAELSRGH